MNPKIVDKSINLSRKLLNPNDKKKYFHFSFIYRRSRILSIGQNIMVRESPKALYFADKYNCKKTKKFPYIHSEIDAISRIWGKIHLTSRHKLVNIRLSRDGKLRQSKPCDSCIEVISAIGLQTFSFNYQLQLCKH